jgi:transcriptional regulator with GAF, ATPase, and Fis domain
MTINLRKSISVKFIAILLVLLAAGQLVGGYLFLSSIRSGFMDSLHERMKRQIKQTAAVMAEPVETSSMLSIETYVDETMKDQDVQSMQVLSESGTILREQAVKEGRRKGIVLTEPIKFLDKTIGTVKLEYALPGCSAPAGGARPHQAVQFVRQTPRRGVEPCHCRYYRG